MKLKSVPILVVASIAMLIVPITARAHVTVQPGEQPAGEFVRADVRVPNERDNAATNKVEVQFPDGFLFASYEPVPGWRARISFERLPEPVPSPFGEGPPIREQAKQATFTATDSIAAIDPGQFRDFGLSLLMPKRPGTTLEFKAIQTYDNGEVVRWIGPPDAEEPASRVRLTSAETAPEPAAASTSEDDNDASKALGIAALVVGVLGLLIGLVALVVSRRRTT